MDPTEEPADQDRWRTLPTLFDLPKTDITFQHIFCYLDVWDIWALSSVCGTMRDVAFEFLEKCSSVEFRGMTEQGRTGFRVARNVLKLCANVQSLTMAQISQNPSIKLEQLLEIVSSKSPKLRKLHLSDISSFNSQGIRHISNCCGQEFAELFLENLEPKLPSESLTCLLTECRNLKILVVRDSVVRGDFLLTVATHCPFLKLLDVSGIYEAKEHELEIVFRNCQQLESVGISHVQISNRTLLVLKEYCDRLETLCLQGCGRQVTYEAVSRFTERGVQVNSDLTAAHSQTTNHFTLGQI